jgi:hypothetical protein
MKCTYNYTYTIQIINNAFIWRKIGVVHEEAMVRRLFQAINELNPEDELPTA